MPMNYQGDVWLSRSEVEKATTDLRAALSREKEARERAEAALREIRDLLVEKFGIAGTPGTMSHAIIDRARAALAGPSGGTNG